jgi:hypothetical protein
VNMGCVGAVQIGAPRTPGAAPEAITTRVARGVSGLLWPDLRIVLPASSGVFDQQPAASFPNGRRTSQLNPSLSARSASDRDALRSCHALPTPDSRADESEGRMSSLVRKAFIRTMTVGGLAQAPTFYFVTPRPSTAS